MLIRKRNLAIPISESIVTWLDFFLLAFCHESMGGLLGRMRTLSFLCVTPSRSPAIAHQMRFDNALVFRNNPCFLSNSQIKQIVLTNRLHTALDKKMPFALVAIIRFFPEQFQRLTMCMPFCFAFLCFCHFIQVHSCHDVKHCFRGVQRD